MNAEDFMKDYREREVKAIRKICDEEANRICEDKKADRQEENHKKYCDGEDFTYMDNDLKFFKQTLITISSSDWWSNHFSLFCNVIDNGSLN